MRAFTAAAVQVAPVPGPLTAESVAANLDKLVDFTRRCVEATGAELVVLPESATTGVTPGCSTEELWARLSSHFSESQMVELTAAVALENFRSKFNVPLGVEAQGFCVIK